MSREAYTKVYIPSQKISVEKDLPGPGQYPLPPTLGRDSRKFSIQGRVPYHRGKLHMNIHTKLVDSVMITVKQNIPGPGTYDPKVNLDKVGIYHLSTIQ